MLRIASEMLIEKKCTVNQQESSSSSCVQELVRNLSCCCLVFQEAPVPWEKWPGGWSLMETLESLLWSLVGAQCAFGMWFSSHLGCEALHKGKLSTTGGSADSQLLHLQELMVIYFNHINCQFLPHFSLSPWRYNLFAFPVIKSIFHLIVSHSLIAIFC